MSGVDQFGGNNEAGPIVEAYQIGVEEHGEKFMRKRLEESAVRLLKNIFNAGLFENPYLDSEETKETIGNPQYMKEGYEAQLKSIVMLKNKDNVLPLQKGKTVYVPKKTDGTYPTNINIVKQFFNVTDTPAEADFAIAFIDSPQTGAGYSKADAEAGGNGYVPMTLQYGPYTADHAREQSITGDSRDVLNRSYKGKTVVAANSNDLGMVLDTKEKMGNKPVIVSVNVKNPMVFKEFEQAVDGIVAGFDVQDQAVLDILTGKAEPSGLLPIQMPADMKTVEEQFEDVPHDMEVHVDSEGNAYDFAYGLDWDGVIQDERTAKYKK